MGLVNVQKVSDTNKQIKKTPTSLGVKASIFTVGTFVLGLDNTKYVVKEKSNGARYWARFLQSNNSTKTKSIKCTIYV